ncbi:MAG: hypothetical protein IJA39_06275 [Clostridia bacterium]|nr:hypothetical protein [Clostridia bacterium]
MNDIGLTVKRYCTPYKLRKTLKCLVMLALCIIKGEALPKHLRSKYITHSEGMNITAREGNITHSEAMNITS